MKGRRPVEAAVGALGGAPERTHNTSGSRDSTYDRGWRIVNPVGPDPALCPDRRQLGVASESPVSRRRVVLSMIDRCRHTLLHAGPPIVVAAHSVDRISPGEAYVP